MRTSALGSFIVCRQVAAPSRLRPRSRRSSGAASGKAAKCESGFAIKAYCRTMPARELSSISLFYRARAPVSSPRSVASRGELSRFSCMKWSERAFRNLQLSAPWGQRACGGTWGGARAADDHPAAVNVHLTQPAASCDIPRLAARFCRHQSRLHRGRPGNRRVCRCTTICGSRWEPDPDSQERAYRRRSPGP